MFYTPEQKGISQNQVNEICERLWKEENDRIGNCHDCDVKPGEEHKEGCDCARCTECGFQYISCKCKNGKPDIWTGLWAGVKECYEQKLICFDTSLANDWCFDLNTLYRKKLNN